MKLLIILLILMVSCGKKDNAGVIQTVNNMASDQVIITDNDPIQLETTLLPEPEVQIDQEQEIEENTFIEIPASLEVTEGRSGNYLAFVYFNTQNSQKIKCIYLGQGDNSDNEPEAQPYIFDFCVKANVNVHAANRFGIKNSAHNIINNEERINAQVALIEGDSIKIILTGSNKKDLLPLKVLAKFSQK
jgi:hypothetical protein